LSKRGGRLIPEKEIKREVQRYRGPTRRRKKKKKKKKLSRRT